MPVELLDLLEVLLNKAEESYPVNKTNIPDKINTSPDSFYPALPSVRSRGRYEMDNSGSKKKQHNETDCTKRSKGHPSLLPGVFCLFCEHGIDFISFLTR